MNSLSGKSVLALCKVFSSPVSLRPAIVGTVRVCHTGVNSKGTVFTKKRGYDITRNPHLNKVSIFRGRKRDLRDKAGIRLSAAGALMWFYTI